jgi:enoyl-CoA hydratase/carnithine racemase
MKSAMVIEIGRLLRLYKDDLDVRCVVVTGDERAALEISVPPSSRDTQ